MLKAQCFKFKLAVVCFWGLSLGCLTFAIRNLTCHSQIRVLHHCKKMWCLQIWHFLLGGFLFCKLLVSTYYIRVKHHYKIRLWLAILGNESLKCEYWTLRFWCSFSEIDFWNLVLEFNHCTSFFILRILKFHSCNFFWSLIFERRTWFVNSKISKFDDQKSSYGNQNSIIKVWIVKILETDGTMWFQELQLESGISIIRDSDYKRFPFSKIELKKWKSESEMWKKRAPWISKIGFHKTKFKDHLWVRYRLKIRCLK